MLGPELGEEGVTLMVNEGSEAGLGWAQLTGAGAGESGGEGHGGPWELYFTDEKTEAEVLCRSALLPFFSAKAGVQRHRATCPKSHSRVLCTSRAHTHRCPPSPHGLPSAVSCPAQCSGPDATVGSKRGHHCPGSHSPRSRLLDTPDP